MPFPVPTFVMAAKDNQLKLLMREYMKKSLTLESFDFYFSREPNQTLYTQYIRQGAPDQVNLPAHVREPLDELARAGQWEKMAGPMTSARTSIAAMCENDVLTRFALTPEYKRWAVAKFKKPSDAGAKAVNALKKELKTSKDAAKLLPLMLALEGGRTPADRKAAHDALVALAKTPEKAAAAFKAAGFKPPLK
jgi:hypothetical protein